METLPPDLQKIISGLISSHHFAARCTCRAWRDWLGKDHAHITPSALIETLEIGRDPSWLKEALGISTWNARRANALLVTAAAKGSIIGIALAEKWGATSLNLAFSTAARYGQLEVIELISSSSQGALDLVDALECAEKGDRSEAITLLTRKIEQRQREATPVDVAWIACSGTKCRMKFGDGYAIHCSSCYGSMDEDSDTETETINESLEVAWIECQGSKCRRCHAVDGGRVHCRSCGCGSNCDE